MAYITPNSDIKILKGVNLDSDYNHTFYFSSVSTQSTYFASKVKPSIVQSSGAIDFTLTNYSYQRVNRKRIRVGIPADYLYDCNYMMFRNTAYGNKWFYAFIDKVHYVNDNVSELDYTIDVMQTWYFDYELGECFVEREHTETDGYGEHIVPESIANPRMIVQDKWEYTFPRTDASPRFVCIIAYVPNYDDAGIGEKLNEAYWDTVDNQVHISFVQATGSDRGVIKNGIYEGYLTFAIEMWAGEGSVTIEQTRQVIASALNELIKKSAHIVHVYQIPYSVYYSAYLGGGTYSSDIEHVMSLTFKDSRGNTYTPKNKKLYSYPYRYISVNNNAGESVDFEWEYFSGRQDNKIKSTFVVEGSALPECELQIVPKNYKGLSKNYENVLSLTDFPECSWSEDSFAKWWAVNKSGWITGTAMGAIKAISGALSGGVIPSVANGASSGGGTSIQPYIAPAGEIVMQGKSSGSDDLSLDISLADTILKSLATLTVLKDTPDVLNGQMSTSGLRVAQGRVGYFFYDKGVTKEIAMVIDDYFNMFGYQVNDVKVPNIRKSGAHLRPHWNYVKTVGCIIHPSANGGLPGDDESKIASIYDKGITFWGNPVNVGNYSLDNSPT